MASLVFWPGWGFTAQVMQPLASGFSAEHDFSLLELPKKFDSDSLAQLADCLPDNCWLIGWSLGGMLAALMANRLRHRCKGLVLLATNASFIQRIDWPCAMPCAEFAAFCAGVNEQPVTSLQRFALLCASGAAQPRLLTQQLRNYLLAPSPELQQGLNTLQQLDIRQALQQFSGRKLAIFSDADALLPKNCMQAFAHLNTQISLQNLSGSHALVLEHSQQLAEIIERFIGEPECGN